MFTNSFEKISGLGNFERWHDNFSDSQSDMASTSKNVKRNFISKWISGKKYKTVKLKPDSSAVAYGRAKNKDQRAYSLANQENIQGGAKDPGDFTQWSKGRGKK